MKKKQANDDGVYCNHDGRRMRLAFGRRDESGAFLVFRCGRGHSRRMRIRMPRLTPDDEMWYR